MNEQLLNYIKQHKVAKNNTYTFSEKELEEFINFINSSTESIDLFKISIDTLNNFFGKFLNKLEKNENTIVFETGEFGLLLLNQLIYNHLKELDCIPIKTSLREINISTFPSLQYVIYTVGDKNVKVIVNETLDKNIGIQNEETGFPVNSQKLFYKKSY